MCGIIGLVIGLACWFLADKIRTLKRRASMTYDKETKCWR